MKGQLNNKVCAPMEFQQDEFVQICLVTLGLDFLHSYSISRMFNRNMDAVHDQVQCLTGIFKVQESMFPTIVLLVLLFCYVCMSLSCYSQTSNIYFDNKFHLYSKLRKILEFRYSYHIGLSFDNTFQSLHCQFLLL